MPPDTIKPTCSWRMAEHRPSAYKSMMTEREQGTADAGEIHSDDMERLDRVLLAHRSRFLEFLARRTGSRADAEEILQAAYVRALERGLPEDGEEGIVAWFSRVLRNASIDAARRRDVERRAIEHFTREQADATWDEELRTVVCACVHDVLPGLKPEYAGVVQAVDLEERPLAAVAAGNGITVNNATVRLHRARKALKTQLLRTCGACAAHGCLDCQCRTTRRV